MLARGAQRARHSESESFTLVLSSAAPKADLERWFRDAAPGDRAIYASGLQLLAHADGVRLARRLANEDKAHLTQERQGNRWVWWIEKRPCEPRMAARAVDRADLAKLLKILRHCAERSLPCPSNGDLAKQLGLRSGEIGRSRAKYYLQRLSEERAITVENRGRNAPRVVTILAAGRAQGRSTAE